ncbi:MAG: MDR family MFS transporter [Syntrophaceticus schinkii]|nr:MDR family MFS transporter [Syntrophaceticus schinkii]
MDLRKRNIITALMVAMFIGAIEGTVVTTAIPTIVKDLSGFGLISWVFSTYFLTSAISTPVYGKLADLYGRKNILCIGITIFLVGSCLCGLSQSMYQLIVFRALQGLGAGSIFTVTYTIVGDIFSLAERAKVQGWLNAVWGIASIIGPFIGGFLIDYFSWHWIFFINVPFGILCIVLLQKNFRESLERKKSLIDYAGMLVLSAAIITLLLGVPLGGKSTAVSLAFTLALLLVFYFIEKKAEEPIVPFEILTRNNTVINTVSFLASAVLIGADVYMPIYIQNVLGFRETVSGLSMAPMSVSWLLSAFILAKAIPKYGEKVVTGFSMFILLLSCLLLPALGLQSPLIIVIICTFVMGFGFGGCFTTMTIAIQASVDYSKRGAATALNSLMRTIGQTIGVGIFGSIFNMNIVNYFNSIGINGIDPNDLYSATNITSLQNIQISINSALHVVFKLLIIITVVCLVLSLLLPSELKEKDEKPSLPEGI